MSRQKFPRDDFEVIVVDDKNDTATDKIAGRFKEEFSLVLRHQDHVGPAAARNAGAALAKGEYLAFTDDDCAPAPDWLRSLAERFATSPACGIGGRTVNGIPDSSCATASKNLADFLYSYYNPNAEEARLLFTNNLAVPTRVFRELGGFNAGFPFAGGEDREFCYRWRFHGHRLAFAPEAVVLHRHHLSLSSFLRQHFSYGRGAYYFHRAVARYDPQRFMFEPPSFYLKLLSSAFRRWDLPRQETSREKRPALFLACLLGLSQAANAAGYFRELSRIAPVKKSNA